MSDEINNDTHDRLVLAFLEYSEYNTRFMLYGYDSSAVRARSALLEIQRLLKVRRKEIFDKKVEIHGHSRKGIKPTNPSERRQRKIDRKIQKEQAEDQAGDN
jgi:RecJ-like exonuclease